MPKGNYHPSIISHRQKMIRHRDYDEMLKKQQQKRPLDKIDISKSDWSIRGKKK